jgi:hypothetical protein
MPVYGLHGGWSALGVDTRWAACACSLQVWLFIGLTHLDRHAGVQRALPQPSYQNGPSRNDDKSLSKERPLPEEL